jgi:glycosyltransferase involved in cell wall biosynthesis
MPKGTAIRRKGLVVAALQLPPPVNGLAVVNAAVLERLTADSALAAHANLAPKVRHPSLTIPSRLLRCINAACTLALHRADGARTLYMPCDGGAGIVINLLLTVTARLLGYKIWLHHHSFAYINANSKLMKLLLRATPRSTRHIFLCATMRDQFIASYAAEWGSSDSHAYVLDNSFVVKTSELTTPREKVPCIGHLSNLCAEKGSVDFINLFLSLRAGRHVQALIAGPIKDAATQKALDEAQAKYPEDIKWLGAVHGAEKEGFFQNIDVFVFPTRYVNEAQPVVLLEALAAGSPILTTSRGCTACDHTEGSPGMVLKESEFQLGSLAWLRENLEPSKLEALRAQARTRFQSLQSQSNKTLADIIAEINA